MNFGQSWRRILLERPELRILREKGYVFDQPSKIVDIFERRVADFFGAPFAIAVDCCTHALELSLRYLKARGQIMVPKHTYPSVPMTVLKIGASIEWTDLNWQGAYPLSPYPIIDASLRFRENAYLPGTYFCLSFQFKKRVPIGRGGMILTDNERAYDWLKRACHDGRTPHTLWKQDDIETMGYHYYMTPEDAGRGLLLLDELDDLGHLNGSLADLGGWEDYPDVSQMTVFKTP